MKRQIKFRAKTTANGHWVYGSLITHGNNLFSIRNSKSQPWVHPDSIGQFTGLKAEDDEELYEGDIVEICRFDHNGIDHNYRAYVDFYMGEFILCVTHRIFYQMINNELHKTVSKYNEKEAAPCWSLSEMYIGCCYSDGTIGNCEDIKIIGNIHDNPRMIGTKQSKKS